MKPNENKLIECSEYTIFVMKCIETNEGKYFLRLRTCYVLCLSRFYHFIMCDVNCNNILYPEKYLYCFDFNTALEITIRTQQINLPSNDIKRIENVFNGFVFGHDTLKRKLFSIS